MDSLTPFVDELPIPEVIEPEQHCALYHLSMKAVAAKVKLHRDLREEARVWRYVPARGKVVQAGKGQTYLGPTVQVRRKQNVHAEWINSIKGTLPFSVIKANAADGLTPQNVPGRAGELAEAVDMVRMQARGLRAALVTHLHGGRTPADSDGWPDNTSLTGQSAHYTYPNDQAACMLWYHDHAMHVTRLNVYAGLAGAWLIRDDIEDALKLPTGEFEIPLVIQDRNLDADENGLTGQLLHKVEVNNGTGPAEFFGPYTLVNGKIWPKLEVQKTLYRFRLLNGSNARSYKLLFIDENGELIRDPIVQIGCDQGLMEEAISVPAGGLILMPAERADILVDFSQLSGSIYLWNIAEAPFDNSLPSEPSLATVRQELESLKQHGADTPPADPDNRRVYPQVMRFDVTATGTGSGSVAPSGKLTTLTPPAVDDTTPVRFMALVEHEGPNNQDATTMLVFREYVQATRKSPMPMGTTGLGFTPPHWADKTKHLKLYCAAQEFYDKINWLVHAGSTEVWYIANFSADAHPIHVHLVDFTVIGAWNCDYTANQPLTADDLFTMDTDIASITPGAEKVLDPNEIGPKDTVRVEPGTLVAIAATFAPYTGRYMYHCHILEHEDHDMMRPFVVVPEWVPHHDM